MSKINIDNFKAIKTPSTVIQEREVNPTIPVRRPTKVEWFRTHSELYLEAYVFEDKENSETYLVSDKALDGSQIYEVLRFVRLYPVISARGIVTLWAIPLPAADGSHNTWHKKAIQAAEQAKTQWTRLAANKALGNYQIYTSDALPPPKWPDYVEPATALEFIINTAFDQHYIDNSEHIIIQQLQGRA